MMRKAWHTNWDGARLRHTEGFSELDQWSKMIISESNLTTFKVSIVFEAARGILKIGLKLNPNPYKQI